MLQRLADAGLVKGKTVGIDATTLEANAALRSIVRRDTRESHHDFLTKRAQALGIETPTRADLVRIDRKRKRKGSNDDWTHPHRGVRGLRLLRLRGERLERPFAHLYETGGMRRVTGRPFDSLYESSGSKSRDMSRCASAPEK